MCGIIGFVSVDKADMGNRKENFIRQAFICGVLRGFDSTGMFFVSHKNELGSFKSTFAGPDFVQHKYVDRILDNSRDHKVLIGHHRFKTSGTITKKDAHPHEHKHITLVHNGGIDNSFTLPGNAYAEGDPIVDTFRLTKAIAETNALNVLKEVEGSYALAWWDSNENALFLARNTQRPLAVLWAKDKRGLYIASEWEMLSWLTRRNGIETEGKCTTLKENVLYRLDIDKTIELSRTTYPEKQRHDVRNMYGPDRHRNQRYYEEVGSEWERWPNMRKEEPNISPRQIPFVDRSNPAPSNSLPWLPGVRREERIDAEQANRNLPQIVRSSEVTLTQKKIAKINKNLKQYKLVHGAVVWAKPDHFMPYNNKLYKAGVAELLTLTDDRVIHIHNMEEKEWNRVMDAGLLVPVIITDITMGTKPILTGKIDWIKINDVINFVVTIDQNSPLKFIPGGSGKYLTKKQFYDLTEAGCSMCKDQILLASAHTLEWVDDSPVCSKCAAPLLTEGDANVAEA